MSATPPFLGIDFGTSKSTMAWFNPRTGQAEVIKNAEGEEKTPSVVYFGTDGVLVGTPAENMLEDEEERERVVASVKRFIGRPMRIALPDGRLITPLEVVIEILGKLKRDAETGHFKEPIEGVVLTCPAAFSETERKTLTDAAMQSGFQTVELLEEPVAAAIAYARAGLKVEGHLLVYDLGGGTFDLAVLARDNDGFRPALAPRGLRSCGGDDFDRALYDHCDEVARRTLQRPVSSDNKIDLHFLRLCRMRKENLTDRERCEFSTYLPGGVRFKQAIERCTFEGLITKHVEETVRLTRSVVEEARDNGHPVATAVLIGGSSRVPLVRQLLLKDAHLPAEPQRWQQQDVAVALGAAYQGHILWGENGQRTIRKNRRRLAPTIELTGPREWAVRDEDGSNFEVWTDTGLAQLRELSEQGLAHVHSLNLRWNCKVTDAGLAHLGAFSSLQSLYMPECMGITDAGVARLMGLPSLSSLNLLRCKVTDAGMAHLKAITPLKSLNLHRCLNLTDAGLAHLKGIASLQSLDLSECMDVTDTGLAHLKALISLRSLKLNYCPRVSDAGLAHLGEFVSLLELELNGCNITDSGLAHLNRLINLRSLKLGGCKQVTDAGLAHLALQRYSRLEDEVLGGLASLQSLDLCDCWQVTDAGLASLRGLFSLRSVKLTYCQRVTGIGIEALQQALPDCKISK